MFTGSTVWAQPVQGQEAYELNYSRGAHEFNKGRHEKAEALFRAALNAKPGDPEASAYLGQSLLRQKKYEEAETVFRGMLQADPGSGPAWLGLGIVQYYRKQYTEAKASLLAAEKAEPDDPLVHYYLGLVHHELGEFEQAPARFRRAMTLSPDLAPTAQYYTGIAHLRSGALDQAKAAFEATVAAEPESEHGRSAKELLGQAAPAEPEPPPRWSLNATTGMEYDTNVVLLPGGTSPPGGPTGISRQSDYRTVLTAAADAKAIQTKRWAVGVSYSFYQSFHSTLTGFDVEDHSPSFYVQHTAGPVQVSVQYIYNYTLVGRSPYLNANTAQSISTFTESENTFTQLQLRYMDKVFRDGRFLLNSARNGKNWLVGVTQYVLFAGTDGRVWLGYTFDKDVTGGGSPTEAGPPNSLDNADWDYNGHHVSTGLSLPPVWTLQLNLAFDWIHQQYLNPNSFASNSVTRRRDNIYLFTGAVSRDLTKNLSLSFQYAYTRDQSNVDAFDYNRSVYSVMLNGSF
jgi:tetratricopeptide (TPR) repeat protein